ncbi:hypothetical protein BVG81_005730 [Haliangium sp. UPWRP_2]|nr:hypothetical protein BVG81_005730 [Haliangium sp. UPWRP_2]
MNLPDFKYHPNPLKTGAVTESSAVCQCCEESRGFIYSLTIYASEDIERVCPWCIATGKAATKFDGRFVDDHPLVQAGLSKAIIEEVCLRTPGYLSWQDESWLTCCNDACEFHGDAPREELLNLDKAGLAALSADSGYSLRDLPNMIAEYEPMGSPAFYKFVCRHCGKVKYHADSH